MIIILNWLIEIRQQKNATQQELANVAGITRQAYNHYETGRRTPKPDKAMLIAERLNFPWEWFYKKDSIKFESQNTS